MPRVGRHHGMKDSVFHSSVLSRNWWATVARGIMAIAVGILAWARPDIFWVSLMLVFSAYPVDDGLLAIIAPMSAEGRDRACHLLEGVFGLVAGVIVVLFPGPRGNGHRARDRALGRRYRLLEVLSAILLHSRDRWRLVARSWLTHGDHCAPGFRACVVLLCHVRPVARVRRSVGVPSPR
jgi:Short repeat of unknown function (DUF308)